MFVINSINRSSLMIQRKDSVLFLALRYTDYGIANQYYGSFL